MSKQKSKLIHAKIKCGYIYTYMWLGNDDFARLWESWDYDSDEGKFEGLRRTNKAFVETKMSTMFSSSTTPIKP